MTGVDMLHMHAGAAEIPLYALLIRHILAGHTDAIVICHGCGHQAAFARSRWQQWADRLHENTHLTELVAGWMRCPRCRDGLLAWRMWPLSRGSSPYAGMEPNTEIWHPVLDGPGLVRRL